MRIRLVGYTTTQGVFWDDVSIEGEMTCAGTRMSYYPYGQEVGTPTANDVAKFGTYTRDAGSGLDYAMNRYYQSTWGRFTTADPYRASGGPADPGSWNRYAYVQGDPVNRTDPSGLFYCSAEYSLGDCLAIQYDMDSGYISTGGGGGGPTLIPWIGMPWAWFLPVFLPVPNTPAPEPECFAQLKYRDVVWSPEKLKKRGIADVLPFNHAFWWVQDRTGQHYIISAGPENSNGSGHLRIWVVPGDANGEDNASQRTAWSSGLSAANCDPVQWMLEAAFSFPKDKFTYNGQKGPNSNSAARYIGRTGGFQPTQPPLAWGWKSHLNMSGT